MATTFHLHQYKIKVRCSLTLSTLKHDKNHEIFVVRIYKRQQLLVFLYKCSIFRCVTAFSCQWCLHVLGKNTERPACSRCTKKYILIYNLIESSTLLRPNFTLSLSFRDCVAFRSHNKPYCNIKTCQIRQANHLCNIVEQNMAAPKTSLRCKLTCPARSRSCFFAYSVHTHFTHKH